MNDITKARKYLSTRASDMATLTSFGLMLATAEQRYRDIRLKKKGNSIDWSNLDDKEVEAALDYAVLKYLKKHNTLPKNITAAFQPDVTLEEKRALAMAWISGQ